MGDATYQIDGITTMRRGTLITLDKDGERPRAAPQILTFFDRDDNGLDKQDLVVSAYDLAYQLLDEIKDTGKLPKRLKNGEKLVGKYFDGGITTVRKITERDLRRFAQKVNPHLNLAQQHRTAIKAGAARFQFNKGKCHAVVRGQCPPSIASRFKCKTLLAEDVSFSPPLTLATKVRKKQSPKFIERLQNRRQQLTSVNPRDCAPAEAKTVFQLEGRDVLMTVNASNKISAVFYISGVRGIKNGLKTDVGYEWHVDPAVDLSKRRFGEPEGVFSITHIDLK